MAVSLFAVLEVPFVLKTNLSERAVNRSLNHTNLEDDFKVPRGIFLFSPQMEATEVTVAGLCAKRSLACISFPGTPRCLLELFVYTELLLFPLLPPLQLIFLIIFSIVPTSKARARAAGTTFREWHGVKVTREPTWGEVTNSSGLGEKIRTQR